MPSEDEIKFAKARYKIQDAICTCFSKAELVLPIQLTEGGGHVDSIVGHLHPDTLAGQHLVQFRTYESPNAAQPEKIEVAIGHTGPNWTPLVTVTSTSTEPEQVLFDREFHDSLQRVLELITSRIKRIL